MVNHGTIIADSTIFAYVHREGFRDDYEALKRRLETLPDTTRHDVMVGLHTTCLRHP